MKPSNLFVWLILLADLLQSTAQSCEFVGTQVSCQATTSAPAAPCQTRPSSMRFQFLGTDCEATQTLQTTQVLCEDFGLINADSGSFYVKVLDTRGTVGFEGSISKFGRYDLTSDSVLPIDLVIETYSSSDQSTLLQRVQFHSSCSAPLFVDDIYGAYAVIGIDEILSTTLQLDVNVTIPRQGMALSSVSGRAGTFLSPFAANVDTTAQYALGQVVNFPINTIVTYVHPIAGYPITLTIEGQASVFETCRTTLQLSCPGDASVTGPPSMSPTTPAPVIATPPPSVPPTSPPTALPTAAPSPSPTPSPSAAPVTPAPTEATPNPTDAPSTPAPITPAPTDATPPPTDVPTTPAPTAATPPPTDAPTTDAPITPAPTAATPPPTEATGEPTVNTPLPSPPSLPPTEPQSPLTITRRVTQTMAATGTASEVSVVNSIVVAMANLYSNRRRRSLQTVDNPGFTDFSNDATFVEQSFANGVLTTTYDHSLKYTPTGGPILSEDDIYTAPFDDPTFTDDYLALLQGDSVFASTSTDSFTIGLEEVPPEPAGDSGISGGALAGIIIAGVVGLAIGGFAVYKLSGSESDSDAIAGEDIEDRAGIDSVASPSVVAGSSMGAGFGYGDQSVATMDYDYSKVASTPSISLADGTIGEDTRADDIGASVDNIKEEVILIEAPPGKLGVVIDTPDDGPPVVHAVKDSSVLAGMVEVGDKLIAIDDTDVTTSSAVKVSKIIAKKSSNPVRKLKLVRRSFADA